MKRFSWAVIFLLSIVLIGTIKPAAADIASGQKAVILQPNGSNDFATSNFDQSVSKAISDGVNYIYLVIPVHQANVWSTNIYASYNTPSDQSLQLATSYIHSKGAKVAFTLHDDSDDGQWRAFINPSDRTSWFASYNAQLTHYGMLAQQTGADEFVIGTEMSDMTLPSSNSTNTANWQSMIANVRNLYHGKLTYCAQHDGYMGEVQGVGFWSKLDYIAVSAYYSMGSDPSVNAQLNQWSSVDSAYLAPVASKYGKQVIFAEVGYQSKTGETNDPGGSYANGGAVDLTAQANSYQALLQYWNARSYFGGVAFWDWNVDPNAGGAGNNDYTPQNKPAEQIMKQWFTAGSTGAGGTTTPAPTAYKVTQTSTTALTTNVAANLAYTATANQTYSNALVDIEIYNSAGQRVYQTFQQGLTLNASGQSVTGSWTPTAAGTYIVKAGTFAANWSQNLYWNDNVASLTVTNPATTTPPVTTPPVTTPPVTTPPTTGGGTTTTPPVTTPPVTTPPTTAANVTIWWPGSAAAVSGVQPFKALVDNLDTAQYTMYWQVDNGALNQMGNATDPINHKESLVDLSSWNWQPSGHYTINFVAKDLNGNTIATKSVVITVTH